MANVERDWRWQRIQPEELKLLKSIKVLFAYGNWTVEAANQILGRKIDESVDKLEALCLVVKQPVSPNGPRDASRYYNICPSRREIPLDGIDKKAMHQGQLRHLHYYFSMCSAAEPKLKGADQQAELDSIETNHSNIRLALEFCMSCLSAKEALTLKEQIQIACYGLHIAGAISRFWWIRGYSKEGWGWTKALLDITNTLQIAPTMKQELKDISVARVKGYMGAGALAYSQGNYALTKFLYTKSSEISKELGDVKSVAGILNVLGSVAREQGDFTTATANHKEAVETYQKLGDKLGEALSLNNLGVVAFLQMNTENALKAHEEALKIRKEIKDKIGIASSLNNLGNVYLWLKEDYVKAQAYYKEAATLRNMLKDVWGLASTNSCLGIVACKLGKLVEARFLHYRSLSMYQQVGDKLGLAEAMEGMATLHTIEKLPSSATLLFAASALLREQLSAPLPLAKQKEHKKHFEACKQNNPHFQVIWQKAKDLGMNQIVSQMLDHEKKRIHGEV